MYGATFLKVEITKLTAELMAASWGSTLMLPLSMKPRCLGVVLKANNAPALSVNEGTLKLERLDGPTLGMGLKHKGSVLLLLSFRWLRVILCVDFANMLPGQFCPV